MYMRNKTIVIETNLYMHLFKHKNKLIINMYLLINLFKNNKLSMIFVFDGAPPPEKLRKLKIKELEQSINSDNI